MAKMALLASYVSINGADMSDRVKSAKLTIEVETLDSTTFGGDGWKEVTGGLKSAGLEVEFTDDFAAGQVDGLIFAILGTNVAFEVRPDDAVVGANNPKYTGTVLVTGASMGGSVGELAGKSINFPTSGAVTRAVA
jgi:hypothetical protein